MESERECPVYVIQPARFIMSLFTSGNSIMNLLREQYELSKRVNISVEFSNELPEFEREAFINMILKDLKDEAEHAQKMNRGNKTFQPV